LLNTDLTDYITANDAYIQNINTSANIFTFFNPSQFLYAGNNIINLNKAGYENLGGIKLGPNTTIDNNGVMSINLATYLGDIEIKGDLITSNLTILGDKTTLETNVFTTEKLEINNSGTDIAVSIVQNGVSDDILSLSNSTGEVLIVRNNGNIGLGVSIPTNKLDINGNINIVSGANNFIFTIDGEDVILNTSNDISRNLNENVTTLNNYINTTSNVISERITNLDTNLIAETANSSNRFIINNVYGDDLSVIGNVDINGNINIVSGANNFLFTIDGEDVILNTSNDISRNLNENVTTLNNYINTTSNVISERITNLDTNLIAETANSSNRFIINNVYGDDLSVIGNVDINGNINIVSGANNFIFTIDGEDVILNTSNDISRNLNENVTTLNNYINTTSNVISERITNLDTTNITQSVEANAQNITNVSNLISERITNLNTNVIAETANSSNRFIINNVYGDDLSVLGNINIVSGANNFIFTIDGEDVILNTSNDISRNLNENVTTLNNYINTTSNLISERITNLDTTNITQSVEANAQNITNVSNVISERITNLNTNVIAETANSSNRFIINNVYGDDLSINGNLNVTNNLIVSGNTTTLNTNLYNTEQLIIDNSAAGVGFELIQSNLTHDIFRISNSTNQVFLINNSGDIGLGITNPSNKIDLNGNINITGSYKINGNTLQYSDLGILPISLGGTGETTAQNAAKAILPSNINTGDYLKYDGTYWVGSAIVSGEWGTSSPSTITNDIYHNDSSVISGVYYASGSLVNITGNIGTGSLGEKMGIYITNNSRTNAVGIGYNTISQIGSDVDASLSIKSKNAGLVYIGNNTSTPLSISSTSVGIGTSSHSAKLHIVETSGTLHNPNTGSVIIDHENDGGASSIIFRSKINRGSDYGFIQYQDTNEINATGELSKLIIGTRNETSDHLILDPSGNVGIGIYSPADKVHIDGNLLLSGTISTYYSDERLKTITETLNDVLPTLEKINVFKYNCNDLAESFGYNKNKVEIGLSAQQIKNYYPELVDLAPFDSIYDNETGGKISKSGENYLTLNYERLIPVLLQAIKELNINNKKLEVKCNDLEKNINQLKKYLI
jgi:tetrahydromethanopterin S-methyltransferase subunit B